MTPASRVGCFGIAGGVRMGRFCREFTKTTGRHDNCIKISEKLLVL